MADEENGKLAPQQRSPAYPYISLDLAIERTKRIFTEIRDHPQPREVLAKAYGKPVTSSATIQTFATLLQYGLLENVSGPARKMRVSTLAQGILNPHAPQEKVRQGLRVAALNPPIFSELWSRFGDAVGLNDSVPLYYLTSDRGHEHGGVFTDKAAYEVLRVYRATLSFANISSEAGAENNDQQEVSPQAKIEAKVGDLVQVEIGGAFQLKEPKRVEKIQEHEGRLWVFLEGEKTGVEIGQVVVQETGNVSEKVVSPPVRDLPDSDSQVPEGWSEESLIDDGGEEIRIRYRGRATVARYEFIRDYLDFKIQRLEKKST
ncbi:hypothetical protein ACI2J4_04935 [Agrobacterium tumefaciens]|uniref:hypothetical protein n=1 Tax=Agrobacterium tumefaciens TaxID=358 RepID=UPI00384BC9AF